MQVLKIYDDNGVVVCQMPYREADMCSATRPGGYGETGDLCGGCCACAERQAAHSKMKYEIVEEFEPEEAKAIIENLRKQNTQLRNQLWQYQQEASRRYRQESDYLPYDDDDRR